MECFSHFRQYGINQKAINAMSAFRTPFIRKVSVEAGHQCRSRSALSGAQFPRIHSIAGSFVPGEDFGISKLVSDGASILFRGAQRNNQVIWMSLARIEAYGIANENMSDSGTEIADGFMVYMQYPADNVCITAPNLAVDVIGRMPSPVQSHIDQLIELLLDKADRVKAVYSMRHLY
jgi:hypothetical protein